MEELEELLANKCSFRLSGKLLGKLSAPAESIELKKSEVLTTSSRLDPNVHIIKSGVMWYNYMNGVRKITFASTLPGGVVIVMHFYYARLPVFYRIEACCKSTVFKIPQSHYAHLISFSHEFAQWALRYARGQLFYFEKEDSVISDNAKEQFISLIHKRPKIIEKVALKYIASYLGITQPYLSLLKKQLKSI